MDNSKDVEKLRESFVALSKAMYKMIEQLRDLLTELLPLVEEYIDSARPKYELVKCTGKLKNQVIINKPTMVRIRNNCR